MIAKHVLIGSFFSLVGLISLLVPTIPFIFLGALVFGPLELAAGLIGQRAVPVSLIKSNVETRGERRPFEIAMQRSEDLQRVFARAVTRTPAVHIVEATYERTIASVSRDGQPFASLKRGYLRKEAAEVNVPLDGSRKVLTVRFWGRMMPQIDLVSDGTVIGKI